MPHGLRPRHLHRIDFEKIVRNPVSVLQIGIGSKAASGLLTPAGTPLGPVSGQPATTLS